MGKKNITASAPGRVCLFGEHQDYLGLPVIPAAINMRCVFTGHVTDEPLLVIEDNFFGETITIPLDKDGNMRLFDLGKNDYLRAVVNACTREGVFAGAVPVRGFMGSVKNEVPQKSGLSSSAAFLVAFAGLLNSLFNLGYDNKEIGKIAYRAEHDELGVPCGQMDQYASAVGGVFHMQCGEHPSISHLKTDLQGLVVAYTGVPKSTENVHAVRVREILEAIDHVSSKTDFDIRKTSYEEIGDLFQERPLWKKRIRAALKNRDITVLARKELAREAPDPEYLGRLMLEHQDYLREDYEVSCDMIDRLIDAAMSAGALGGKLTGAGMGGSVVVLAPGREDEVAEALGRAGGEPWIVSVDRGVLYDM